MIKYGFQYVETPSFGIDSIENLPDKEDQIWSVSLKMKINGYHCYDLTAPLARYCKKLS